MIVLSVFNGFEDLVLSLYNSFDPDIKITKLDGNFFDSEDVELKLKEFLGNTKTTYDERKKHSIVITRNLIKNTKWVEHFEKHKKKDDLADCFLQAKWYIKNKLNN